MLKILLLAVFAVNALQAADLTYDAKSALPITRSYVEAYPPGRSCPLEPLLRHMPTLWDRWCVRNLMEFEGDIYASNTYFYDDVSYNENLKDARYSGNVNIVLNGNKEIVIFSLIFEKGNVIKVDLWVDDARRSADFLQIRSLSPYDESVAYWFYTEKKIGYIMELSDGTRWKTVPQESMPSVWDLGSRIVKIGTIASPVLINLDTVDENYPLIKRKDCLEVLPT